MTAPGPGVPAEVQQLVERVDSEAVTIEPVWLNQLGGRTFRLDGSRAGNRRYLKWQPGVDFTAEVARLRWAGRFTTVPPVLKHGRGWLLTAAIAGRSAIAWTEDPAPAVIGLAHGLRQLHDRLPVADCPFDWRAARRLAAIPDPPAEWGETPPVDRLVVCQGDACAPNTLLHPDGRPAGHVDLGRLGVADRWADLAVASMSLAWNFGAGWDQLFYDSYRVDPDPVRIEYYRWLWTVAD